MLLLLLAMTIYMHSTTNTITHYESQFISYMHLLSHQQYSRLLHYSTFPPTKHVSIHLQVSKYNMLSYHRETALQGALVLAKSRRLELGDNILRTL